MSKAAVLFIGMLCAWAVTARVEAKVMVYSLVVTNTTRSVTTGEAVTEVYRGRLVFNPFDWPISKPHDARVILWRTNNGTNEFATYCPAIDDNWPFTSFYSTRLRLTFPTVVFTMRGADSWLWITPSRKVRMPNVLRGTLSGSDVENGETYLFRGSVVARFLPNPTRSANRQHLTPAVVIENIANSYRALGYIQVGACQ